MYLRDEVSSATSNPYLTDLPREQSWKRTLLSMPVSCRFGAGLAESYNSRSDMAGGVADVTSAETVGKSWWKSLIPSRRNRLTSRES